MKYSAILAASLAALPIASSAQEAFPVEIHTVETAPLTRSSGLTGTIEAIDSYPAGFRDGGRIIDVAVNVGDLLQTGDVIARVDPARTQAALRASQASLDAAEAALVQANQARDRAQKLLERGTGTQADLDATTQAALTAQSDKDQAEAQLRQAERAAEDTTLRAIENAIVTERYAEPGQVVGQGQAVVTLASSSGREAVFYAPNSERLTTLLGVTVMLSALGSDDAVTSEVTEISPVVSPNGAVEVRTTIDDSDAARFTIGEPVLGRTPDLSLPLVSIPWTALTATAQGPAVWLLDPSDRTVQLQQVEILSFSRNSVEIAEGLTDGDQIVAAGSQALFPGRSVETVQEAAK
jgi:RND family efflux transporter MFP subunit